MELLLLILFILGFVIVASIDAIQKRRKFLTELNKRITNK